MSRDNPLWTAQLNPAGYSYNHLRSIFPDGRVPLTSCTPVPREGPHGRMLFYQVDVPKLTAEQFQQAVKLIAGIWQQPPEEIERDMLGPHGWPLREENITITYSLRAFL